MASTSFALRPRPPWRVAVPLPAVGALLCVSACSPPASVWVPQLGVTLVALARRDDADHARAELVASVFVRFEPRGLRAVLPSVFDVAPALSATPCDEDDTVCMSEAQPEDVDVQRLLAELL